MVQILNTVNAFQLSLELMSLTELVVFVAQDYLVNILLETARKEHCEGARYDRTVFLFVCFIT